MVTIQLLIVLYYDDNRYLRMEGFDDPKKAFEFALEHKGQILKPYAISLEDE